MRFDLHLHTSRYSRSCSILDPRDLIYHSLMKGLDGVAITEHDALWSKREVRDLIRSTSGDSLVVLRGKEIATPAGHMLVFNFVDRLNPQQPIEDLTRKVRQAGGATILAHPFRYGQLLPEPSDKIRNFFSLFDAVEILTPNHAPEANEQGLVWAEQWGLKAIGSSDSHDTQSLGTFVTEFSQRIRNESDLVETLRGGLCRPLQITSFY